MKTNRVKSNEKKGIATDASANAISYADVQRRIICVREMPVILDADVAELYGVETKRVNEAVRNNLWQKQLHLFECPFYYIEYGIAQLGALQVWANFKKDPKKAIDDLFRAESLGDSRPLPELFAAANIKFDFTAKTIEPLMQVVWDELSRS